MRTNPEATSPDAAPVGRTARRAQIVDCAIDAIADLGFARASVDQIARRVGVSKGVITYHFPSKDEIVHAVIARVLAMSRAYMEPRILAEPTAAGRLRVYIETALAFFALHRKPVTAMFEIAAGAHYADGSLVIGPESLEGRVGSLEQMLVAGQKAGEFRRFDTRVMAQTVILAIDGGAPLLRRDSGLDLELYASELATLFALATRKQGEAP